MSQIFFSHEKVNVAGVKGRSSFSLIIDNLPLTAPFDYMHCILLGVFRDLISDIYQTMSTAAKNELDSIITKLSPPREIISYSKKIRKLDENKLFKANELFKWMFYVAPLVMKPFLSDVFYENLLYLICGFRLLLESSLEEDVCTAESLLNALLANIRVLYNNDGRVETINVHALKHLPDQVRRYGPLYTVSAMSFESRNRTLGEVFTGSNYECEIICRRVIQLNKLNERSLVKDDLSELLHRMMGINTKSEINFQSSTLESDILKRAGLVIPTVLFSIGNM